MFDVVMRVKANDGIAKGGKVPVGIEILPMHAAVAGGVDEQRPRRRRAAILEMEAQGVAVQCDELVRDSRPRMGGTAASQCCHDNGESATASGSRLKSDQNLPHSDLSDCRQRAFRIAS